MAPVRWLWSIPCLLLLASAGGAAPQARHLPIGWPQPPARAEEVQRPPRPTDPGGGRPWAHLAAAPARALEGTSGDSTSGTDDSTNAGANDTGGGGGGADANSTAAGNDTLADNGTNQSDNGTNQSEGPTEIPCSDEMWWSDSKWRGCDVYREQQFCSPTGGVGPGWNASWGTFLDFRNIWTGKTAWMSCCGCSSPVTDSGGDGCDYYDRFPNQCGCCDDDDFRASEFCRACPITSSGVQDKQLGDVLADWPEKTTQIVFTAGVVGDFGKPAESWADRFPMLRVINLASPSGQRGAITGTIPAALSRLHLLEELVVRVQGLSGTVPPELGELPRLRSLDFSQNFLEGTIPATLARIPSLQTLSLASNSLHGTIPPEFGRLASLNWLDLSASKLSGTIPVSLASMVALRGLRLDVNALEGTIPPELGSLSSLTVLWLGSNKLRGTIPRQLWGLGNLTDLSLGSNRLGGTLADQLGPAPVLERLELSGNSFVGTLPPELAQLPRLKILQLAENTLSGPLTPEIGELRNLVELSLKSNKLTGTLPLEWCDLQALQILDISNNLLQGPLRAELGNLSSLSHLYLSHNQINGTIPASLGNLHTVITFDLQDNLLEGTIPDLSRMYAASYLRVRNNRLSGTVPTSLFRAQWYQTIDLANNRFEGTLPQIVVRTLSILDVSNNPMLGGQFPDIGIGYFLTVILAGGCNFTGAGRISTSTLKRVDFSGNKFTELPTEWFDMMNLVELDLSNNMIQSLAFNSIWSQDLFQNLATGAVNCVQYARETVATASTKVRMSWDNLQKLDLSGNPLGLTMSLWDLLYLMSLAPNLLELRLAGCSLRGRMPQAGALAYYVKRAQQELCRGAFSTELTSPGFAALRVLDLSNNSIEALLGAPPAALTVARLHLNNLSGDGLHPRWFQDPSSLEVWGNPLLRVDVQVPQAPCPSLGSADLQANLNTWSPQGNAPYECTSLCAGLKTRYAVDSTLNASSLCRCRAGTGGAGMNCTACPADTYSVVEDAIGMLRTCWPCPTGSSTGGRTSAAGVEECLCPAGWYMPFPSDGNAAKAVVEACVRCAQWPYQTTTLAGATRDDQCQCNPDYEGLRVVLGVCGCQDGQYLDADSKKCVACTETEDCDWGSDVNRSLGPPKMKEYPSCLKGSFNARNGTFSCTRCDRGTYAAKAGSTACTPCPDGLTTTDVGAEALEACVCEPGSYRPLLASGEPDPPPCKPCPQGMRCAVGSDMRHFAKGDGGEFPKASEGFMTRVGEPLAVYRCLNLPTCPGGPPGTCGDLRDPDAIACGVCQRHAFEGGEGRCLPCDDERNGQLLLTLVILVAVIVIVAVTLGASREAAAQPHSTTACFIVLGVAFTSAQSLSVFQSMQVQWFEPLAAAFAVLRAVSFDLRWLRIPCLLGAQPIIGFAPRQFIAPASIPLIIVTLRVKRRWAPRMHLVREFRNTVGTVFSLFFISIITSAATPFICYEHPKGQGSSMRSAPSVLCDFRAEHAQMVTTGLSALALVPLPFLAICIWGTLAYPRLVASTSDQQAETLRAYRFLFFRYQPHAYYFALVQFVRSLAVCFIPVLILDPAVQVCAMVFVLLVFMSAQLKVQPWRGELTNSVDGCSSVMMLLLLVCTGMVTDMRAQLVSVQVIGALAFFGFTVCVFVYFLMNLYRRLRIHPYYHVFICHHKADAAAQARLLDLLLEAKSGGLLSVFIDSDDLQELDRLFDIVRSRVARLVVYLTRYTLTRPWCAGEVVTAALHSRRTRITRVETPSFSAPTPTDFENIAGYVDSRGCSLAEYSISWEDVGHAFSILLNDATPCVEMASEGGSSRFEALTDHLLNFGGSTVSMRGSSIVGGSSTASMRGASTTPGKRHFAPDAVLLSSDPFDDEATASVSIFQYQAQPLLLASLAGGMVRLGDLADADPEWFFNAVAESRAVLVFLSRRSMHCVPQLALIVDVMFRISKGWPGPAIMPVSLPDFSFPGGDYYRFELPILLQIDAQVAQEMVGSFFKRIALPLATEAARSIIEIQVRQIAARVPQSRLSDGASREADGNRMGSKNMVPETSSQRLAASLNRWRLN